MVVWLAAGIAWQTVVPIQTPVNKNKDDSESQEALSSRTNSPLIIYIYKQYPVFTHRLMNFS
jgi:hypothetical protein